MPNTKKENIRNTLYDFFSQRIVYHSIFWLIGFLLLFAFEDIKYGFFFHFTNALLRTFILGGMIYYNYYYLVTNYLTKDRFITYCGLLVLSVIIITPLSNILFFFKYANYPELQNYLTANHHSYFLINIIVVGASTIFKIISDWVKHQRERADLQTQTMQSELRFLKSQINPHFLFNTLNNLYALTLKKSDKAPEIVIKLSEMMRYMLYECNEKRVPLSKEVKYIQNYLDLEALRQGKEVEINFDVYGEVQNQTIAPLMFIPFLENSFKHGLNHHINQGYVDIRLDVEPQTVRLRIENSKPDSVPLPEHPRSGGIGLVNVRRRLNILYPENYQLNIENEPNSYAVDLKLTLD
ncbi:MAG: histidine kinase [Bacteroidota bacterium]